MTADFNRDLLGSTLRSTLDVEIPCRARVALLDYPNHDNVGDSAIWLGELAYLAERECDIVYLSDLNSFNPRHLRGYAGIDFLLLHGGGNLGDLWQHHHRFRERVLTEFSDWPIVQLPQTIHFDDPQNLIQTQRVIANCRHFTLMVRDSTSHDYARRHFDCRTVLCPDSAFALDAMTRLTGPQVPILWLGRTDTEAAAPPCQRPFRTTGVEYVDWLTRGSAHPFNIGTRVAGAHLGKLIGHLPTPPFGLVNLLWMRWHHLARSRVAAGQELLSRGSVIVTDRLHAHILCILLNLPHVILDNRYGKLSSFASTWNTLGESAHWANSRSEALFLAQRLAQG